MNNDKYKGLWIGKFVYNKYNSDDVYYVIFNDCDNNVLVEYRKEYGYNDILSLIKTLDFIVDNGYIGKDGFIKMLKMLEEKKAFIGNAYIKVFEYMGEIELVNHYTEYRATMLAEKERKHKEWYEEYRAKEAEREKKRIEELDEKIKEIEDKLYKVRKKDEDFVTVDNDSNIIIDLMNKYNVDVSIRTKGWIMKSLLSITFNSDGGINYSYSKMASSNSKGSQAIFRHMFELWDKICNSIEGGCVA